MDVGARLSELLRQRRLSANALSKRCNISQSMLSAIIRGERNPTVESVEIICGALGITLVEFFEEERESGPYSDLSVPDRYKLDEFADFLRYKRDHGPITLREESDE